MRGTHRACMQSCLAAWLIAAMAGCASANPVLVPEVTSVANGVYELFLVNLPLDMLLFTAAVLLAFWKLKSPTWSSPKGANVMMAQVVVAGIVVAVAGALIDFYAFFMAFFVPRGDVASNAYYFPEVTLESMAIAGVGVFVSVYAASIAIARLRPVASLVPAALITAVNLFAWGIPEDAMLFIDVEKELLLLVTGCAFLVVPPMLFKIGDLHRKRGVRT